MHPLFPPPRAGARKAAAAGRGRGSTARCPAKKMGGWLAASFSEKAPHRGVKPSLYNVGDPLPLAQRDVGGWRAADDVGFAVPRQKNHIWERGGPSLPSLYARRLTEAAAVTKALQIHVRVPNGPRAFAHKPNEATYPCVGAAAFPVGSDWRRRILRPRPARLFGICRRRLRNPARAAAIDAPGLVLQPFHGARAPALPEPLDVNLTR